MGDGGGGGFSSGGFYGSGFESMGGNEAFANFMNQAFGGSDFSGFGSNRQPFVEVQVCIVSLGKRITRLESLVSRCGSHFWKRPTAASARCS
jgi:hypothetical protein